MSNKTYSIFILSAMLSATAQAQEVSSAAAPAASIGSSLVATVTGEQKAEDKKTALEIHTGVLGKSTEDKYVNSKYAGGTIDIVGSHKLSEQLSGTLDVSFLLAAGSFSSQYSEEGRAPSFVGLNEAYVTYKPWKPLTLDAGVLAMSFSSLPTTNIDGVGFPSLRQTVTLGEGDISSNVFAIQAIPTSDTANVKSAENGITTSLMVVGADLTSNALETSDLTLVGSASRFEFRNLNSSAAADSQFLGNSVVGMTSPQPRFVYGFKGYEGGLGATYKMSEVTKIRFNGALLRNEEAPNQLNRAYTYSAGLTTPVAGLALTASAGYFYNESDSLPASYTSSAKGSNNRFGTVSKLAFENEKEKVSGMIQYTRANEIEDRAYTADRETILVTLEVAYDVL